VISRANDPGDRPGRGLNAYLYGVVTSVRNNASAYGFSVIITASFGFLTSGDPGFSGFAVLLWGLGAGAGFGTVTVGVWRIFRRQGGKEAEEVVLLESLFAVLAIAVSIAVAYGASHVAGLGAWPLTGFLATVAYLVVEGADVFAAARMAQGRDPGSDGGGESASGNGGGAAS
jgi:uncharacterized membrane protein